MTFTIKKGSVQLLKNMLCTPGWAITVSDVFNAGKLINEILPELDEEIKANVDVITQTAPSFEITDKQIETVKKCIKFNIEKGVVYPGVFINEVLIAVKMEE